MTDQIGSSASPGQYSPTQTSTADVARDQASNLGQSVSEAGGHITQTASDQARVVIAETTQQARDLLGEAGGQARDQAAVQQHNAARQLRNVADELEEMAAKAGQSGLATEVARQAAGRIHGAAAWLEEREPADVVQVVRDFARRRPGTFLLGAAVAGLAAGRLARGLTAARSADQLAPPLSPQPEPLPPAEPELRREIPSAAFASPPAEQAGLPLAPEYPATSDPAYPGDTVYPGDTAYPGDEGYQSPESYRPGQA